MRNPMEVAVKRFITERLLRQGARNAGAGGRSEENRGLGFAPAFLDFATQTVYPSRFFDGRAAPFHLLDGLPNAVVVERARSGRVIRAKVSIVAGFVRNGYFYTRAAAARAMTEWPVRDVRPNAGH